jgi:hypothetical protein
MMEVIYRGAVMRTMGKISGQLSPTIVTIAATITITTSPL